MIAEYQGQEIQDGVVRFTADWCAPCRSYAPIFAKAAERLDADFYVIDVEENMDLAREHSVTSIPAVFHVRDGEWTKFDSVPTLPELRDAVKA